MSLIEDTLYEPQLDRVAVAIERLRAFEPKEGYYLSYSGGKDSDVILELAKMSGVKFDAHYNRAMEPPEVIYHIRKHPEVIRHLPKLTMWQLIRKEGILPMRTIRYCCRWLKERNELSVGRRIVTGIRWAESVKRSKRKMFEENTYKKREGGTFLHPIIDWSQEDVWQFITQRNIEYCTLYDEGFTRIGCVGCPNANLRDHVKRWPKLMACYERAIVKGFDPDMWGETFTNGHDIYKWWITGKGYPKDGGLFA